ncbi:carbohydrate ABC transporter permease [Fusibacter ferrireducens]|uniref:Carbohydrate ABC transporter permease n=1 Tax=Fusibacter ferrireducens TaxID=2785058 RepID=A0ABR9ZQN5_9FIRM|nr:carbohydrate ABC transporter permease [Fusibacter ferrireducens]MBF4692758.1 carbohydrate ABC transporter permease [Fusibacter ferrireducens]
MIFSNPIKMILKWFINLIIFVIFFIPFYWMLLTSVKSLGETLQFPPTFFVWNPHFENFKNAFEAIPFLQFTFNSIVVAFGTMIFQFITIVPAAYAYARYDFKLKNLFFGLTLSTMMIPSQLIFLPIFLLFSKWGMINTYWALILPFASSAFGIFMLRQTFKQVPEELIEAARLDKSSELKIIFKIMLPIAKPTVFTLGLLTFIETWNNYFWPLVMTTNDTVRTLPLGIASLRMVESGINYHLVMAGNVILILPILFAYFFAQRHIIDAFTYMGEK